MKLRDSTPKRYKGRVIQCNCNSKWPLGKAENVTMLAGLTEKHPNWCHKCKMFLWVDKKEADNDLY